MKVLIRLKTFFKLVCILSLLVSSKVYADTTINFGTDISGEFPTAATYNNFKDSIRSGFNDVLKHKLNLGTLTYTFIPDQINENVKKFTFGFSSLTLFGNDYTDGNDFAASLDYDESIITAAGISMYFGFKLNKKISLFADIGFGMPGGMPLGVTLLWNFYEKLKLKNGDLISF